MHNSQPNPKVIKESGLQTSSTQTTMTMEEFLENDLEGYEYVKGELVPLAAAAIVHGEIGVNLIIPWLMSRLDAEGKFNPCRYWFR